MADIKWLGHACFRVKTRDATVLMDPTSREQGVNLTRQRADLVTLSRKGGDGGALAMLEGEYTVVDGPGEYEVQDIFVTGIRTGGADEARGIKVFNTVYLVEIDDLILCHLGDLHNTLSPAQVEALGEMDVLFVPIGPDGGLTTAQATEVIGQVTPKMVIPMRYRMGDERGQQALRELVTALGFSDVPHGTSIVLRKNNLTDRMSMTILVV